MVFGAVELPLVVGLGTLSRGWELQSSEGRILLTTCHVEGSHAFWMRALDTGATAPGGVSIFAPLPLASSTLKGLPIRLNGLQRIFKTL